ncbi:DUF2809 domain-containing protein [Flavobacterium sp.]|uniref:ribosomal maturation YjgA family protein n=1 Tax=Flavobacterium sp. TaxID=239 RepID=UPI0026338D10|nr:DUF2809 domain-containing protein [Flavobacterium sp.]
MKNINIKFLIISCCILIIEILIAIYAKDDFIRPIFGDYLASILVFYLLATFLKTDLNKIAILSLLISYMIEFLQYINILELLHLDKIKFLNILLGNSFSWTDMIAYTLGILTILLIHNPNKIKS